MRASAAALGARAAGRARPFSSLSSGMGRPRVGELVLVRHGESEGNIARRRSLLGDHSVYAGEFLERHSSQWRLSDQGREQAISAGAWLRDNGFAHFDVHFTSEYLRAMETAALLGLPGARWRPEVMLRERDMGQYDLASQEVRATAFAHEERRRVREMVSASSLFWSAPGGESLAQVVHRVDSALLFLNRRFADRRVVLTCHGEVMWAFRIRFERLTHLMYREMQQAAATTERIHNGQILVYSRRDPRTGLLSPDFRYMRFVCPWDTSLSGGDTWRPIERSGGLSATALLRHVGDFPRLVNNADAEPDGPSDAAPADANAFANAIDGASAPNRAAAESAGGGGGGMAPSPSSSAVWVREGGGRIALLSKTPRWRGQSEQMAAAASAGDVRTHGTEAAALLHWRTACEAHEQAVEQLESALRRHDFDVAVIAASAASASALSDAQLVCAAGGDGTLLRAVALTRPHGAARCGGAPIVGVNTDPLRSTGALCSAQIWADGACADAEAIAGALRSGAFETVGLPIMAASAEPLGAIDGLGALSEAPLLAVNEVLIAEADPSRPLLFEIGVDDEPTSLHRGSGALVSTQAGTGAWISTARQVDAAHAEAVLRAAVYGTDAAPPSDVSRGRLAKIARDASADLVRHADATKLQYLVREAMRRRGPQESRGRHGLARRVRVRPYGWDVHLYVDGARKHALPANCAVVLEVAEESSWPRFARLTHDGRHVSPLPSGELPGARPAVSPAPRSRISADELWRVAGKRT